MTLTNFSHFCTSVTCIHAKQHFELHTAITQTHLHVSTFSQSNNWHGYKNLQVIHKHYAAHNMHQVYAATEQYLPWG